MTVFSMCKVSQTWTLFQQNVTKQETYMDDIPLPSFYQPMFREEITALLAYVDEQCEKMQQYIGQEHNILGPVLETFKKIETKSQGRDNRNYLKFRYRE